MWALCPPYPQQALLLLDSTSFWKIRRPVLLNQSFSAHLSEFLVMLLKLSPFAFSTSLKDILWGWRLVTAKEKPSMSPLFALSWNFKHSWRRIACLRPLSCGDMNPFSTRFPVSRDGMPLKKRVILLFGHCAVHTVWVTGPWKGETSSHLIIPWAVFDCRRYALLH